MHIWEIADPCIIPIYHKYSVQITFICRKQIMDMFK